jgi:RNA-directed DNA polymerase
LVAEVAVVNGPEDTPVDWDWVRWHPVERDVQRLRQRIFTASQAGDHKKVRNLQKLMLRSRSNALVAVRRVTEQNAGRKTAGVDGKVAVDAEQKAELVDWLQHRAQAWSPRPVKRVYVPKSNGRRRPIGIPVIADRCLQAVAVNALEPEWEARFEPRSYGFRPGRGCHDAIVAIHTTVSRTDAKRLWVLDADLAAALDASTHCSFRSLSWSEQPVLGCRGFDTQAFSASGADVDSAELALLDTVHDGLAGDAVCEGGFEHREPALGGVVDE